MKKLNEQEIQDYLGPDWPCRSCKKAGAPNCRRLCDEWWRWWKVTWRGIRKAASDLKKRKKNR